jgi:hypothetical protein
MATYSTDICAPADEAPATMDKVARCKVCGVEWAVKSPTGADTKGCAFCGAGEDAVTVSSETPTYRSNVVWAY